MQVCYTIMQGSTLHIPVPVYQERFFVRTQTLILIGYRELVIFKSHILYKTF
ncbi:hypothetical protein C2G38_2117333 [Gigaspora rosea]|uniref:Uncharacterized protein n=1 Tax=Gigaspora rosea TaxID=44941 RepID=A0A397U9Y6_9GLOM|nr:hypothetical protein C2G38_2117333 [Gigaspora rosea]